MWQVINQVTLRLCCIFSLACMLLGIVQAMEQKKLKDIPLDGKHLIAMSACGPGTFLTATSGAGNGKNCYEVWDLSGKKINTHDQAGDLNKLLVLNNCHVMLFDCSKTTVNKLDLSSGKFSHMFELPEINPQNILSCSIIKTGLLQISYWDENLRFNSNIFDYNNNINIQHWVIEKGCLPDCLVTVKDKGVFWLTLDQELFAWYIDSDTCVKEIDIPMRPKGNGENFEVSKLCWLSTNHIVLVWGDGLMSIWNLKTKEIVRQFRPHNGTISSILGMDGGFFVTGGADGLVKTWNISCEGCLHVFDGHTQDIKPKIKKLALLPGNLIASATLNNIKISKKLRAYESKCLENAQPSGKGCLIF